MKKILLLLASIFVVSCSKDISANDMLKNNPTNPYKVTAEEALKQLDGMLESWDASTRGTQRQIKEIFAHRIQKTRSDSASIPDTLLYIVNFDNEEGYAILGADVRMKPVLALIDAGHYDPDTTTWEYDNVCLDSLLEDDELDDFWCKDSNPPRSDSLGVCIIKNNPMFDLIVDYGKGVTSDPCWTTVTYTNKEITSQIGPYLKTKWGQRDPYNRMCSRGATDGTSFYYSLSNNYSAGCFPVAVAQVIAYHHYPLSAFNHTYNWEEIDKIIGFNANDNVNDPLYAEGVREVAHLVRASGLACRVHYDDDGSSSTAKRAKKALESLGYSGTDRYLRFSRKAINKALNDGSLALISGLPKNKFTGHAWVIDGCRTYSMVKHTNIYRDAECTILYSSKTEQLNEEKYYHCNFGWGGTADGYYLDDIFDTAGGPYATDDLDDLYGAPVNSNGNEYTWCFRTVVYNNPN